MRVYGSPNRETCKAAPVDVSAIVTTIWQAEGVLMELLHVDAAGALACLELLAALNGEPLDRLAAEVVELRTI